MMGEDMMGEEPLPLPKAGLDQTLPANYLFQQLIQSLLCSLADDGTNVVKSSQRLMGRSQV